jgi:hypothetical protein
LELESENCTWKMIIFLLINLVICWKNIKEISLILISEHNINVFKFFQLRYENKNAAL